MIATEDTDTVTFLYFLFKDIRVEMMEHAVGEEKATYSLWAPSCLLEMEPDWST